MKKLTTHLALGTLFIVNLLHVFPATGGKQTGWSDIALPSAILEARLSWCASSTQAHQRGCEAAIDYLKEEAESQGAKVKFSKRDSAEEKYSKLKSILSRQTKPESQWVSGALNAWLNELDPHSRLMLAKESDKVASTGSILVTGAGTKLRFHKGKVYLSYVIEGSGAEESGLQAGDELISINGQPLAPLSDYKKRRLFKNTDAPYWLEVKRDSKLLKLSVKEKRFSLPNVEWHVRNESGKQREGYIRVRSFDLENTCNEIASAVRSLQRRNVSQITMNLRDNPGGLVREAQCTAGLFLGKGQLFAQIEKLNAQPVKDFLPTTLVGASMGEGELVPLFTKRSKISDLPLKVEVNQNTASAAEMLAAALQDKGRAKIAGTRTFGKGSMQSVFHPWGDEDLYLTRTTHRISRPSGKTLQFAGVTPDILIGQAEGPNFPREQDLTQ